MQVANALLLYRRLPRNSEAISPSREGSNAKDKFKCELKRKNQKEGRHSVMLRLGLEKSNFQPDGGRITAPTYLVGASYLLIVRIATAGLAL